MNSAVENLRHTQFFLAIAILASAVLQGCAIAVPTHQVHPPQTLGRNAFQFSAFGATSATLGPEAEAGSPLAGMENDDIYEASILFGARLAYGVLERLDIEAEIGVSFISGSMAMYGLKYQWLGNSLFASKAGDWNSSLRVRGIAVSGFEDDSNEEAGEDTIFEEIYVEKMSATGYSIANSFGYMFANWFGVYMGAQFIEMDLDYRYRDEDANGTLFEGERIASGYGPFLGFNINTTGTRFRFLYAIEFSSTKMPATYSDRDVWIPGFAQSANFAFDF